MDCLLAIPSTEGYHTVELRYMPTGTLITMIVSIVSIIVFAGFVVLTVSKKAGKWFTTKILKKEYTEEEKRVLDLSPIGEYEDVFGIGRAHV